MSDLEFYLSTEDIDINNITDADKVKINKLLNSAFWHLIKNFGFETFQFPVKGTNETRTIDTRNLLKSLEEIVSA